MKFQPSKYDSIIFDMDGVITGEYIYWDAAALTVYELLYSYELYGKREIDFEWCRENLDEIYRVVFSGGKTVKAVKNLGVNTNWDLAYIVFCVSKYLEPELDVLDEYHFESVRMFIENIEVKAPEVYGLVGGLCALSLRREDKDFRRGDSVLWDRLYNSFQAWFLGSEKCDGINVYEKPLLELDKIKTTLKTLKSSGIKLGIGTGRPKDEIMHPLCEWGLYEYFEPNMIVTYDDVLYVEKELKCIEPLSKPNPFVFIKAAFGGEISDADIIEKKYDKDRLLKTAVVGDAPSDIIAAKSANMPFVGVLTGVDRVSAEKYFFSMNSDFILGDMTELV